MPNQEQDELVEAAIEAGARAKCAATGRDPDGICSYDPTTKTITKRSWAMFVDDAITYITPAREHLERALLEEMREWFVEEAGLFSDATSKRAWKSANVAVRRFALATRGYDLSGEG